MSRAAPTERLDQRASILRAPVSPLPALSLNMTPMIDVVFLLLIYFVLAAQLRPPERSLASDVPARLEGGAAAADPFELPRRPILLSVRSFGAGPAEFTITTDDPTVGASADLASLSARLAEVRGALVPEDQVFIVQPAPATRWEHALRVFGAVQRAGFGSVRLASPEAEPAR